MKISSLVAGIFAACAAMFAVSCSEGQVYGNGNEGGNGNGNGDVPEGYFVATFGGDTRAVSGQDSRVKHVMYLIYNSDTRQFVASKEVLTPSDETPTWPMQAESIVLPNGNYTAFFLGNVTEELFDGQETALLQNYQGTQDDVEIFEPVSGFNDDNMFYFASIPFSQDDPAHSVLLQRIVSQYKLTRNFVDADAMLDKLVNNIVEQLHYKDIIQTTVDGVLGEKLTATIEGIPGIGTLLHLVIGGVDAIVNALLDSLVEPLVDLLYQNLLEQLVHELGVAIVGNESADEAALVGRLNVLLNPWTLADAHSAVLNLSDRTASIGLDLNGKRVETGTVKYAAYDLINDGSAAHSQKYIEVTTIGAPINCTKINVAREGLIGGAIVDDVAEELLLTGALVDVEDPFSHTPEHNRRYEMDYSVLDLGLESYTQQEDGNHSLTVSAKIGDIANIDNILGGIPLLGPVLELILEPVKNIVVDVPLNLPLLGIDNLDADGSWSEAATF